MKKMIDPPSGWRYGFPKVYDNITDGNMRDWLIANGYPQEEIDRLGSNFTVRIWVEPGTEPMFQRGLPVNPNIDKK